MSAQANTTDDYFAVLDGRGVGQIRFGVRDGASRVVCHCSSYHEMNAFFERIKAGVSEDEAIRQGIQEANWPARLSEPAAGEAE